MDINFKEIKFPKKLFVTGTGTDVGKSYATGWLARELRNSGIDCITQKMIQTGNTGRSEDIELHRKIMGIPYFPEDLDCTTFPEVFSYPCSPDLASRIDKREINLEKITKASETLASKYDVVLIEGAGGLMVPIIDEYLTADYVKHHKLPLILVLSGELGSINHALLTLNAIKNYGIELFAIIYNPHFDKDNLICEDTRKYLKKWIKSRFGDIYWWDMDEVTVSN